MEQREAEPDRGGRKWMRGHEVREGMMGGLGPGRNGSEE